MTHKKTSFQLHLFLLNSIWHSAARTYILTAWKYVIIHCSQCEKVFSNQQISPVHIPVCTSQLLPILIALLLLERHRIELNALERIKSEGFQEPVMLVQLHTRWYLNGSCRDFLVNVIFIKNSKLKNKPQILNYHLFCSSS